MQGVEVADLIMREIPEETYPDSSRANAVAVTDRTLQCSPFPVLDLDTEFVIANYDHNLDWLTPFADRCHIYHKGNGATQFKFRQWENLPNVGRETHSYLYHIITNYDRLADITVFNQDQSDHLELCYNITDFVIHASKEEFSCKPLNTLRNWHRISHVTKWLRELQSGYMRRAKQTIAEFWFSIFGSPHPPSVKMCLAGCFAATRKRIHRHPKEFYEKIMTYFTDHVNPEEGHYMERLWYSIFT